MPIFLRKHTVIGTPADYELMSSCWAERSEVVISMPVPTCACECTKHDKPCKSIGSVKQCIQLALPPKRITAVAILEWQAPKATKPPCTGLISGVACQRMMETQHGCRAIETAATRDAWAQAAHALVQITRRKPCQCGDLLQHCCRSFMEAAAGVHQSPMPWSIS